MRKISALTLTMIFIIPVTLISQVQPITEESGLAKGKEIYTINCLACHGANGEGGVGPNMTDKYWIHGGSLEDIIHIINVGVLSKGMIPWESRFTKEQIHQVSSYILTLQGTNPENAKAPEGDLVESKPVEKINNAPVQISFTKEDIILGNKYFTGSELFKNGAPSCISCHNVNSLAGLGGGKLGTNLTDVIERLGGIKGLSAWLISPPVPTMAPIFSDKKLTSDEINALVAFLNSENEIQTKIKISSYSSFLFYGIFGALLAFLLIGLIWKFRFRAVRKPMVGK